MKVSFDLDDTLIPSRPSDFLTERKNIFQKLLGIECIRKDAIELIKSLKSNGHSVGIYTTSYRSKLKILLTFLSYGIKLDFIINEKQNRKVLKSKNLYCSKFPPAFGVDLHIDDSEGVGLEAIRNNFQVIIIEQSDTDWKNKIIRVCGNLTQS